MSNLPSLYVLTAEYEAALAELAELDLPEDVVADTLEGLAGTLELKAQNVAAFVRNLEATAEAIKTAEGGMAKRRKAIENRSSGIRKYLLDNMLRAGITKIECPYFTLSIQKNPPSVVIDNPEELPQHFMKIPEPPPPTPDKTAIASAIKGGESVPGAHIEQGQRLVIK